MADALLDKMVEDFHKAADAAEAGDPMAQQMASSIKRDIISRQDQLKVEQAKAAPKPKIGRGEAFLRSAAQGATLGFSDELRGVGSALTGGSYDEGVKAERERLKEGETAYPYQSFAAEMVGGLPTGAVGAGRALALGGLRRLGAMAGLGAAQGGVGGLGQAEGSITERAPQAAIGAGLGGALGAGGDLAIGALSSLGQKAFAAGQRVFTGPPATPKARQAVQAADEFGINLTRGQATGDVTQQAVEQRLVHGVEGQNAQARLQSFYDAQRAARDQATQGIAGGQVGPRTGGEILQGALQRKAEELKAASDQGFDAFRSKKAFVAADEASGLKGKITNDLANLDDPIYLDRHNHPIATKALGILDDLTGLRGAIPSPLPAGQNAQLSSVSVQAVDKARRAILKLQPAPGSDDARVLGAVRRAFGQRLDDMVNSAGFRGDATAIDDLKQARGLWAQFSALTKPKPGDPDDSRKLIADIIKQDRTGEEVANWLTNYASVGLAGKAARAAAQIRQQLGGQSPEWDVLRKTVAQRVFNPETGQGGDQALASSIDKFLKTGGPLAQQLFTPDELGQMRRLSNVLKTMVGDPKAKNPSKSGHEVGRLVRSLAGGAQAGGVTGGIGGIGMSYATGDPKYALLGALLAGSTGAAKTTNALSTALRTKAATQALPSAPAQIMGPAARSVVRAPAMAIGGPAIDVLNDGDMPREPLRFTVRPRP
jgi:hypothetical protein